MPSSTWQRFTAAQWSRPSDPSIHADVSVDAEPMLAVIQAVRDQGQRLTPNAFLLAAIGQVLVEHPEMNVQVGAWRVRPREHIDAWITMSDEQGRLSGQRVDRLHERDAQELQEQISHAGREHDAGRSRGAGLTYRALRGMPVFLARWLTRLMGLLIHTLRLPLPFFGLDRKAGFGAVHVTNVGPFGLRRVAAPIPPITRQAYLFTVGEIHQAPVVREGEVTVGRVLPMMATIDHRYAVGVRAARWARSFQEHLTDVDALISCLPEAWQADVRAAVDPREPARVG